MQRHERRRKIQMGILIAWYDSPKEQKLSPLEDESAHALALVTAKREGGIFCLIKEMQLPIGEYEPMKQFFLGPIAAGDDEKGAHLDQRCDFFAIVLAYSATLCIGFGGERDGVESSLVQDGIKAISKPGAWLFIEDIPFLEAYGQVLRSILALLSSNLIRKLDTGVAVINADHVAHPPFLFQRKDHVTVSGTKV